jgi:hypothetical protein
MTDDDIELEVARLRLAIEVDQLWAEHDGDRLRMLDTLIERLRALRDARHKDEQAG